MADNTQLKKNLDKVSYIAAGILAIGLLALPFVLGGRVKKLTASVSTSTDELESKKGEAVGKPVPGVEFKASDLDDLWNVPGDSVEPLWNGQLRPGILRVFNNEPPKDAVHVEPCVTSIELVRDTESRATFLRISGEMSQDNAHVVVESVELERKVDGGTWKKVKGFEESGNFTYDDKDVVPGSKYSYRCTSIVGPAVENDKTANLEATDRRKTSKPIESDYAVPFDIAIEIKSFGDLTKDPVERFFGVVHWWDHGGEKAGKISRSVATKGFTKNEEFGETLDSGMKRYLIRRITPETDSVTLVDRLIDKRMPFKKAPKSATKRSIDSWEPVTLPCGEVAETDDTALGDAKAADAKAADAKDATKKDAATTKKAPAPTETKSPTGTKTGGRRRRGFGD